jgi:hypothetical protein
MDTLKKYANKIIKPRVKAMYFAEKCDPQSCCAKKAREILSLLEKKKNLPDQNQRIKEELWVLLDEEKLLSNYNCCVLAKLTLEELLRLMMQNKSNEELICYVEMVMREMEEVYVMEVNMQKIDIQALSYKHMGLGMKYLKQIHLTQKKSSFY